MNPFRSVGQFKRDRAISIRRIARLTPEDLDRQTMHATVGEITVANLLAQWVVHDLSHLRQLMVMAARMYLTATGPWRKALAHLEIRPEPSRRGPEAGRGEAAGARASRGLAGGG